MWAFQVNGIKSMPLSFLWYAIGIVSLHPAVFRLFQTPIRTLHVSRTQRILLSCLSAFILGWIFWEYRSVNITRDGFDWIKRATEPVWHLYLREPLTIGLHRLIFVTAWKFFEMTSVTGIALLAIVSGVWSIFWMNAFIRENFESVLSRRLAWLLLLSSGGFSILLFGHIDIYPVFTAGLIPALFYAQRYYKNQTGLWQAALFFSIAFLLHLSGGWLIPAFFFLPFIVNKNWLRDSIIFWSVFLLVQFLFWSFLLFGFYDGSLLNLLARLYEEFNVGPDKSMFIPWWAVLAPRHLLDTFNDYLYITAPGVLLLPFTIRLVYQHYSRQLVFWGLLVLGYFLFTFLWNPDRLFPEDWDLFSAFAFLVSLFNMQILLSSSSDCKPHVYIATMGTISFVMIQIWFHHITPFVPPWMF